MRYLFCILTGVVLGFIPLGVALAVPHSKIGFYMGFASGTVYLGGMIARRIWKVL